MAKKERSGLSLKHKIGYGLGDAGGCMTFALMGTYGTRYFTNVLEVDTTVLAILLLIWNVWDAVNDPMMGALMDKMFAKSHNPKGKFRPWLLRSTPLLAVTAIVFWTVPTFFEGIAMLIVLFFCKIAYEACYTMFNIPMGSLLSAMANTDGERAVLSSARGFGSMVGNMVPMMIFPALLEKYGDSNAIGYGIGAALCAAVGFVTCLLHYFWTEERNISDSPSVSADNIKFTDILHVFKVNRPFLALCIHGVSICCMQYVGQTLGTYMYADVMGDIGIMQYATVVSMPLMLAVLFGAPALAKKFGLERTIRYSLIIGGLTYVALFAMHMVMDVPAIVHMLVSNTAMGIAMLSIQMQWGLVGETIDYNEMITGKRTEGSIYGTFNLSRRIGQTIGNSAAVLALGWIGYDAEAAKAGLAQTAGTITGLKVICVLVPAFFVIGSWAAFKYVWNITPEVRAEMAARKAAKSAK
ncbi:MAG: MFS transporter [Lachnospiraceae bacterium]|nr:MFS transporter [Lachnospiraceae bacterium]